MISIGMTEDEARAVLAAIEHQRDRVGKILSEMRSMKGKTDDANDLFECLHNVHTDIEGELYRERQADE